MFKTAFLLPLAAAAALASPALAQNWSAEIYGGGVFDRDEDIDGGSFGMDAGTALGLGVYNDSFLKGAELGFDLMHTDSDFEGSPDSLESLSLMLNARVPFFVSGGTTAYVGAGLGAIRVDYDGGPGLSGDDTVPGGQIGLGIRHDFNAFSAFGELKHQMGFDDASIGGVDHSYEATSAVVGLRFAF